MSKYNSPTSGFFKFVLPLGLSPVSVPSCRKKKKKSVVFPNVIPSSAVGNYSIFLFSSV